MKKKQYIKPIILLLIGVFLVSGCSSDSIVLEGVVYEGEVSEMTGEVSIVGPASGARVWAIDEPDNVAECDSEGFYEIQLEAPFTIGSTPTRIITLIANYRAKDEQIGVEAKLGETNQVRDFLVWQHHEECFESPRDTNDEEDQDFELP